MKPTRETIYQKYGGKCAYCGHAISIEEMEVDHLVAKRTWEYLKYPPEGLNGIDNLMPSCTVCNHYKRDCALDEFRNWLLGELHIRITKLPKRTTVPRTAKRIEYLKKVCERYGITPNTPFSKVFYFELADQIPPATDDEAIIQSPKR